MLLSYFRKVPPLPVELWKTASAPCGFTANTAKRDARERQEPPEPPSFNQVAAAINQALLNGDRTFALEKLQSLWNQGFHDLVEELCITFKRDWQFQITNQGVRDANAT